jgi:signal transduction histidine kinase
VIDRIQIEQVILHLVCNGVEAMSDAPPDERALVIRTARGPQGGVRISVQDTGRGLSDEARRRLFDPFFSTKPNGLGLGLSVSRSIVAAHQGELFPEPNVGRGAVFTVALPAAEGMEHEES